VTEPVQAQEYYVTAIQSREWNRTAEAFADIIYDALWKNPKWIHPKTGNAFANFIDFCGAYNWSANRAYEIAKLTTHPRWKIIRNVATNNRLAEKLLEADEKVFLGIAHLLEQQIPISNINQIINAERPALQQELINKWLAAFARYLEITKS